MDINKKNPRIIRGSDVPKEGFEPSQANAHYALNVARLPVPPLRLADRILPCIFILSTLRDVL
jgi:hypothetical protein